MNILIKMRKRIKHNELKKMSIRDGGYDLNRRLYLSGKGKNDDYGHNYCLYLDHVLCLVKGINNNYDHNRRLCNLYTTVLESSSMAQ